MITPLIRVMLGHERTIRGPHNLRWRIGLDMQQAIVVPSIHAAPAIAPTGLRSVKPRAFAAAERLASHILHDVRHLSVMPRAFLG